MSDRCPHRARGRRGLRQRGAVLVVSMILLVVLTLLGVTAMNTSQLEERMASNAQFAAYAFQAAETGLSEMFDTTAAWNIAGTYDTVLQAADGPDPDAVPDSQSDVRTLFLGWAAPPTGSLYSATSFQAAHFDFLSGGCTIGNVTDTGGDGSILDECLAAGGLVVNLHGGAFQLAPKSQ